MMSNYAIKTQTGFTLYEKRVLYCLTEGMTYVEIGKQFGKSERTIKSHVATMCERYELNSRLQLIALAFRSGAIE